MKNLIYKFQFWLVLFFYKMLLMFPESSRFKFGDFLGSLSYRLIKKRRLIALTNLKMAFPEKDIHEVEKIAKESFKIMIKAFLCTLWFKDYLKDRVTVKNKDILDREYNKGKGVIAALMHMGNMEAAIKAAEGYEVVTVAKKQRNPYINDFITKSRKEDLNLTVFSKSKSTSKDLIRRLNNREIFALFSDHRDKGAIVNFFGMEAKAPTGAVSLALKFDIPLVWGYNYFNADNSSTTVIKSLDMIKTGNFKEDVLSNTQLLISEMEKVIREHPEQWMWFHDRWNLYSKFHKKKR
ncbi:lysophospholipid acyltransferase family protein [Fusobacterium sp. SYSU M8A802]